MDLTVNRGYPFPQCDPPLTADESNAPVQTRLLAETMAADFTTVDALLDRTYQLPTTILRITSSTSIGNGEQVPFDVVEYDPEGWATLPAVITQDSGIYLLTAFVGSVAATNVQHLAIQFTGNSGGFHLQGTSPPASGFGSMAGSSVTVRAAGETLGVKIFFDGTTPNNFDNCWFSVTRMVLT